MGSERLFAPGVASVLLVCAPLFLLARAFRVIAPVVVGSGRLFAALVLGGVCIGVDGLYSELGVVVRNRLSRLTPCISLSVL